jgi:molybdopterin-guanine dinucleotide biosynthesis protein A
MTSIVLAGGHGTRLGQDKTKVEIAGKSLIERVLACVAPLSSEIIVVLSQRDASQLTVYPGMKLVFDIYPNKGALGGIYTGLMSSKDYHNLVVASDMPFLNADLLRYMLGLSPGFDVVVPRIGEMVEPLHAVYAKGCLDPIAQLLQKGGLKANSLFHSVKVRYVEEAEVDRFDPQHLSFFNINTKADLSRAKELLNVIRRTGTGENPQLYPYP